MTNPKNDDSSALERRIATTRPHPPEEVADDMPVRCAPDASFAQWLHDTFIAATGPLANEAHEHLMDAKIGCLWTNRPNTRKQMQVLATAEVPFVMGGTWVKARAEQQLRDWFEADIDFLLTFYGPECDILDDRALCALVEHELYHCAQAMDRFGAPKFDRSGSPVYAIRGHDVEEFVGVVERYGVTSPDLQRMVNAAKRTPMIGDTPITIACGTVPTSRAA